MGSSDSWVEVGKKLKLYDGVTAIFDCLQQWAKEHEIELEFYEVILFWYPD